MNAPWHALAGWLRRAPIADPVDRRNAPFVQLLLIFIGCFVPLNKGIFLYTVLFDSEPVLPGFGMDLATDVAITVATWTALYLVRTGRFRAAVMLFLGTLLVSAGIVYAAVGARYLPGDQLPYLILAIGGLVLGRRVLWSIFGVLLAVFTLSVLSDVVRAQHPGEVWASSASKMVSIAGSFLIVTIILDRTIAALRESLDEAHASGERLRHAMAERERAQAQLVHAQKMEATGRIASGVAHDFDNVLSVVLGYAMRRERLADQGTAALVGALEGVELAARRAMAVSRKLLNFSRQDTLRPEVFDAAQALREVQPMLRQLFDADTRVECRIAPGGPLPVCMDRGQFELLLLNVAANARDAMPEGGRFAVDLRRVPGEAVELALADDGCGMPESVRQRVFEPFYTTKPVGAGTGLGLAVVHDMVAAAGGSLAVQSTPGEGTTFRVRLPLAERCNASGLADEQVAGAA